MRKLLALLTAFASPALAQTPAGVINAPIYATGYISQGGGTNVTTNIPPQPNHPTNLNIYTTGAISGTWTIKLPNPAFEGQMLSFNCGAAANAISVTSSDGSSIDSTIPVACSLNTGFTIQFDQRSNIWRNIGSNNTSTLQLPAFTGGDCTSTAGSVVLNCTKTNGVAFGYFATGTDAANLTGVINPARLPNYAARWGVSTSNSDNAVQLNNAISEISSGGGGTLILPSGVIVTSSVTLRSNVYMQGAGVNATTLKLKNGANNDLLVGLNAYSEFASPSGTGGITDFSLEDMTIDGNSSNQTGGSCVVVFGYHFSFSNLYIKNCYLYGIRSSFQDFAGGGSMESYFNNITIDTTGSHGWWFDGPHDSMINNVVIIDAGQAVDNTSYGMFIDTHGNARISSLHTWHRSSVTNRTAYQFYDSAGGSNISTSHFEGSRNAPVRLNGIHTQLDSSNSYYSAWNANASQIEIAGSNNTVKGHIFGSIYVPGTPDTYGVQLLNSTSGNNIDLIVTDTVLGSARFVSDGGLNTIRINGAQATGPGYSGTPSTTSKIDLDVYGATSNANLHQYPNLYKLSSVAINGATPINDADIKTLGVQSSIKLYQPGSTASWATITFDNSSGVLTTWPILPSTDGGAGLGSSALKWSSIYSNAYFAGATAGVTCSSGLGSTSRTINGIVTTC